MTPTIQCPVCARHHALFWVVDAKGKRKLHVNCDHQPVTVVRKGSPELRYHTATVLVHTKELEKEFKNNKDIPEQWSAAYARKKKEDQSCDLKLF